MDDGSAQLEPSGPSLRRVEISNETDVEGVDSVRCD